MLDIAPKETLCARLRGRGKWGAHQTVLPRAYNGTQRRDGADGEPF
jgi:hypothetical protein